jgi:hypothetical protein
MKRRDKDAWLLLLVFAVAVGLIVAARAYGAAPDPRKLPQARLERLARNVARHGGVTGTCAGCATHYMKLLSDELVVRAFPAWSEDWAVCVVYHESGFNPGAVSPKGALGLSQILPTAHPEFHRARLRDPVYNVRSFAHLSRLGRRRGPWRGQGYVC